MRLPKLSRLLAIVLFIFSIALGMQIGVSVDQARGQVKTLPPLGEEPPKATETTQAAPAAAPAASNTTAPAAPNTGSETAPRAPLKEMNSLADQYKLLKQMDQEDRGNQPSNPAPPPEKKAFVPSQVEAYLPPVVAQVDPRAVIKTSIGDITIRLFETRAPVTVQNFISLARGEKPFTDAKTSKRSQRRFFDGLIFHRVVPGYLIQSGCPIGTGRGTPGFTIPDEISDQVTFSKPGMVAMAPMRDGTKVQKDSNGSQFFITLNALPTWDGEYTIFGEIEKGMDVVNKIAKAKTGPTDRPIRRIYIHSVEIIDELSSQIQTSAETSPPATTPAADAPAAEQPAEFFGEAP